MAPIKLGCAGTESSRFDCALVLPRQWAVHGMRQAIVTADMPCMAYLALKVIEKIGRTTHKPTSHVPEITLCCRCEPKKGRGYMARTSG